MKRLEQFIHNIRRRYYARLGYHYDAGKRMWFKTRSTCCDAPVSQTATKFEKKVPIEYRDFCDNCKARCQAVTRVIT